MRTKTAVVWVAWLLLTVLIPGLAIAAPFSVNSRSAILIDTRDNRVLYEKNADTLIAPASITKVLSLYLIFEAIRDGRARLWDNVNVSCRAASTGGSRMGLRAGDQVPLEEIIKGMAVVSGNDACVAAAEHFSGSVEQFVREMNIKARMLGMRNTVFMTPNGLPAKGQLTTARDISRLSLAYLHRFPESLNIHSMCTYTYRTETHRNANRLLGKCPGVDGLKTGFVCASGYNLAATAKRGDVRLLAVVMGAPSAGTRASETEKLLEYGFQLVGGGLPGIMEVQDTGNAGRVKIASDAGILETGRSCEVEAKPKIIKAIKPVEEVPQPRTTPKYARKKAPKKEIVKIQKAGAGKQVASRSRNVAAKQSSPRTKMARAVPAKSEKVAKVAQAAKAPVEPSRKLATTNPSPAGKVKTASSTPSIAPKAVAAPKAQPTAQTTKDKKGRRG
ncbi:D-alanyl-D-alanine carboxypeptidase family protein [Desulforhabdus sp. TSK]|uniref:D-alanyl-D-alanine carboxypeptidase family protein n=1 Tax=Desulforhabdus sp. TSK TaxID=2925014 RepID=UPI001FC89F73|nr:D-alanyl-D-alanine carboxypeptidase family protein [Desulforhabdus sp. TSK]GKT10044.1 D-alanyl-D-alanine carboxypeptidase [Desulforhabdus sp. TSK]